MAYHDLEEVLCCPFYIVRVPRKNPTPRIWDTWGGLMGIKMLSNIIVRYRTLLYAENFAKLSDLFANGS